MIIPEMTYAVYTSEEKDEEKSPALNIVSIHRYDESMTT